MTGVVADASDPRRNNPFRACRKASSVSFCTYREAREQRQLLRLEAEIVRCDSVVLDEPGYIPLDKTGAESHRNFNVAKGVEAVGKNRRALR